MNVSTGIKQAAILAIGIIALGFCIKSGLEGLAGKDRKVVVKGLAEKEVEADKVTWPILSKEIGNDLPELYQKINITTSTIRKFLLANGVKASEINVNAPVVIDLNAEQTAEQFAKNSKSKLDKIMNADQGQFSIEDRDSNTPYIKKVRVVTTVTYSLKD